MLEERLQHRECLLKEGSGWVVMVTKPPKHRKWQVADSEAARAATAMPAARTVLCVRHPQRRWRKGAGKLRRSEAEGGNKLARSGC